jgi:hypothetical protein
MRLMDHYIRGKRTKVALEDRRYGRNHPITSPGESALPIAESKGVEDNAKIQSRIGTEKVTSASHIFLSIHLLSVFSVFPTPRDICILANMNTLPSRIQLGYPDGVVIASFHDGSSTPHLATPDRHRMETPQPPFL